MRAARLVHHRDHLRLGKQDPVGIAQRHVRIDELLAADDHAISSQPGLLRDAQRSPRVCASLLIGPLHMDDGDVRPHGLDVDEPVGC